MFRYNGVQLSEEFSQGVIRFFGEHGDALSDDAWRAFHRWYNAVEMKKCVAEFEEAVIRGAENPSCPILGGNHENQIRETQI